MKTKTVIFVAALAFALTRQGPAQTYDTNNVAVQTFAGSGLWGYVNGVGQETMFNNPNVIVANSAGDLIVLDAGNFCLRKISTNGSVTSFAVLPDYGVDGVGSMTIDKAGIIWIAGSGGRLVRVTGGAQVSTVNLGGSLGWSPGGICADSANNIFVSDPSYHKIYRYRTNGVFELFAGSGNPGSQDGNGIFTSFTHPRVFAADAADNLYVWDAGNYLVRRINQNADVTTIAGIGSYSRNGDVDGVGQSAAINYVATMCADNWGNILMCCGTSIRKMSAQLGVTTLAGSFGVTSFANGAGALARFNDASGVCFSNGKVFVADKLNQRVRVITFNPQPELLTGADLSLGTYAGLRITGFVGRTYRIESSPDMTNWTTRASVLLTATPYLWFDENPVNGSKYYRAFLLP